MPLPISGGSGSTSTLTNNINQLLHAFTVGQALYWNGTAYAKGKADSATTAEVQGVVTTVTDANNFVLTTTGTATGLSGLTPGEVYWLSDATAGLLTTTQPTAVGSVSKPVLVALTATTAQMQIFDTAPSLGNTAVIQYGETLITNGSTITTALADITGATINLPSAGTYEVEYFVYYTHNTGGSATNIGVYDSSNVLVSGSQSFSVAISGTPQSTVSTGKTRIIATGATTYKLRGITSAGIATVVNSGTSTSGSANSKTTWTQIGAAPVPMDLVGEYGEQVLTNATSVTTAVGDIPTSFFTIPTAGTWDVSYNIYGRSTAANAGFSVAVYNASNVIVPNSAGKTYAANDTNGGATSAAAQNIRITTTGVETFHLRGLGNVGTITIISDSTPEATNSAAGATSKITWRKISGFVPSSGQTVDYVNAIVPIGSIVPAVGSPMTLTLASGNIPLASNTFTLTAGKTYRLEAGVTRVNVGTEYTYQWRDTTNNIALGSPGAVQNTAAPIGSIASAVITPSSNMTVQLWSVKTAGSAGSAFDPNNGTIAAGFATITQLGSSAVIAGVYASQWATAPAVITSTATAPTFATTNTSGVSYMVQGKTLFMTWNYFAASTTGSTGGTASTMYKFQIPNSYVLDVTKVTLPSSTTLSSNNYAGADATMLGTAFLSQSGTSDTGKVIAVSSTELAICTNNNPTVVGNGRFSLNVANATYSFTAQIPLV